MVKIWVKLQNIWRLSGIPLIWDSENWRSLECVWILLVLSCLRWVNNDNHLFFIPYSAFLLSRNLFWISISPDTCIGSSSKSSYRCHKNAGHPWKSYKRAKRRVPSRFVWYCSWIRFWVSFHCGMTTFCLLERRVLCLSLQVSLYARTSGRNRPHSSWSSVQAETWRKKTFPFSQEHDDRAQVL